MNRKRSTCLVAAGALVAIKRKEQDVEDLKTVLIPTSSDRSGVNTRLVS